MSVRKEFSPHKLFETPVPRPRPPIRNFNTTDGNSTYVSKDSENLLLKSTMYSTKHSSEEFLDEYTDDEDEDDIENYNKDSDLSTNTTYNSCIATNVHKRSFHRPNESWSSAHINNLSVSQRVENQSTGLFTKYHILLYTAICIIIFLCMQGVFYKDKTNRKEITKTESRNLPRKLNLAEIDKILDKSIERIQNRFHNQKATIWNDISSGIYDISLIPTKPTVVILFGNETNTLNCLAQLLGQLSGTILGSNDYLLLTPKDFPNDVGQTIHDLKWQISEKKAVIVQDLLGINTEAIKAFHNFCDREKPLVRYAVYIITIIVDGYKSAQRELEFIEKQIFKKLSNYIDKDILDPLITRLTDGIIVPVLPESGMNFNYAECSLSANKL
ncbi:hypothetical protein ANTQUA_LOCUS363 [Anthophora quadrimaculata]